MNDLEASVFIDEKGVEVTRVFEPDAISVPEFITKSIAIAKDFGGKTRKSSKTVSKTLRLGETNLIAIMDIKVQLRPEYSNNLRLTAMWPMGDNSNLTEKASLLGLNGFVPLEK
jgi:hypothetical protein